MKDKTNQALSISSALLVGALIGAGVGILTAPRSGEETRTLLREKSGEVKDKAAEAMTETRDRAGRAFDKIALSTRERIPALQNQAKQVLEETAQKVNTG